jgi:alpha-L-rhamnosidase
VFALTSCLNRDVQRFYRKWIDDMRDAQLPGAAYAEAAPLSAGRDGGAASSAGVLVPWALYRCYADRSGLDAHVTSMGRWIDAVAAKNPDLVWRKELGVAPGDPLESGPSSDAALLATAELSYAADALAQMMHSGGVGLAGEAGRFQQLAKSSRAAFNREFVLPDGKLKSDTQTAYAVAIARGLLEGETQQRAGQYLAEGVARAQGRSTTGVIGTALLLPALSRVGRDDVAYALLQGFAQPSQGLPRGLKLGALGEWMYDVIGGIALDPAAPAGRHVFVRPRPGGGLSSARASFASLYGPIETAWSLADHTFRLKVTIPVGSTATVRMPYPGAVSEAGAPAEKSSGVKMVTAHPQGNIVEIDSGTYELSVGVP